MSKFEPYLALEASAGSGKTFALSVRFVALILRGANINEILALTFTKKAANEMQKRVIENFLSFEKKEAELRALCELLGEEEGALVALRDARREEFLRQRLKIHTFDSFFVQILRAFALNVGLMSDFETSENSADLRAIFVKLLDDEALRDVARYVLSFDKNFLQELEILYNNAYFKEPTNPKTPSDASLKRIYEGLRIYCLGLENKHLHANFKSENLDLEEFLKKPFMAKFETTKYLQSLNDEDPIFAGKRREFLQALSAYARECGEFKLSKLLCWLGVFFEAKKRIHQEQNCLSFSDVSRRVLQLSQSELRDMIYFRLDGRISHLLVDEFQDTNVVQYEILKPIIAELVSGEGVRSKRSFFYVGDKKQSIYAFRQSKKELFDFLQMRFGQIKRQSLDTNYRSRFHLVDFINRTFEGRYENFLPQRPHEGKNGGLVRIVSSKEQESEEIKHHTLIALREQVEFLHENGVAYEDICILCWKNNDADMILDFLKGLQIPAFTQSNILLENKANVRAVLEYAKFCIFGDAFYAHFIENLLGFSPPRLRLDLSRSAAECVVYLARKLRLDLSDVGLLQFVEYARGRENFAELLFSPCPLKIKSERSFGISIMTVHKSKGLEFENVIVLDNLSQVKNDGGKILLDYDFASGWELQIKDKKRALGRDPDYMAFMERMERMEMEDDLNKLYVALTRAKSALIIIKRNAQCVTENNFSYFNGGYLFLFPQEIGELSRPESRPSGGNLSLKDSLEPRVKIPPQELEAQSFETGRGVHFGNAFHFCMQNLKLPRGENLENVKQRTRDKFRHFLSEGEFEALFKRVENLLQNEEFQALLRSKRLLKEQNLSFEGRLQRLDLLALDEEEAVIVDYKTGLVQEGHGEQVGFYKKAVGAILAKKTRAFLVYCLENGIKILEN